MRLTEANLLTSDDVPRRDPVLVTDPGEGRAVAEASVCVPPGAWDSLGATKVLTRNFRYDWPDDPTARNGEPGTPGYTPLYEKPEFYTAALQFADEAAAVRAQKRYRDVAVRLREGAGAPELHPDQPGPDEDHLDRRAGHMPPAAASWASSPSCRPTSCPASRRDPTGSPGRTSSGWA